MPLPKAFGLGKGWPAGPGQYLAGEAVVVPPAPDTTPNPFTFTDVTGATVSTDYTSNTITVSGIDAASPISVTGGTYSKNGGAFTAIAGTVVSGDTVAVKGTSSGSASTAVNVVLTIGGVSDTYTVTTAGVSVTVPAAPSIAITPGNSSNSVVVTPASDGGSAFTAYKVYRGLSSGSQTLITTIPIGNGLTYVDPSLTNGVTYHYRVVMVNAIGDGASSAVVTGAPSGAGLTANEQLLAARAKDGTDKLAVLGGSRDKGAATVSSTQVRTQPVGALPWAIMTERRFQSFWWYSTTALNINSTDMSGFVFANDGEGLWHSYRRLPKLLASDAQVVVVPMSSNSMGFNNYNKYGEELTSSPFTAAGYTDLYKQMCLDLILGGKVVILSDLIPRGVFIDPVAGVAISSITFSGTTATVTTATAHGLPSGTPPGVTVTGSTPSAYNVTRAIVTVTGASTFTYQMATTPSGNATVVGSYVSMNQIGGVWGSGGNPRAQVPIINTIMRAWAPTQGIPYIETYEAMTETQVNGANTDVIPKADLVRFDLTHWNIRGAYLLGKLYNDVFETLGFNSYAYPDPAAGTNLFSNPTLAGTGGTVNAGFVGGSVAPDGLTLSRTGTTATVTSRKVTSGGVTWLEIEVDDTTMADDGSQEYVSISMAGLPAAVSGNWYTQRARQETELPSGNVAKLFGQANMILTTGANSVWTMIPYSDGGSGQTDGTATMLEGPAEAYTSLLIGMPSKATSTASPVASLRTPSWRKGVGIVKFRFASIELRNVADPATLMYDELNTTAPALTSSASLTTPEEQAFETQITTNRPVQYTLGGADAARFSIDATGRLKMLAVPDYEAPVDADANNVYALTLTLTPFNPSVSAVSVNMTVTVTDIADGTYYNFTGADGTDLADLYPATITRDGNANGIIIQTNKARNNTTTDDVAYIDSQTFAGGVMQARWQIGNSSGIPKPMIRAVDRTNGIFFEQSSNKIRVRSLIAGTSQASPYMAEIGYASGAGTLTGAGAGNGAPTGPGLYVALANGQNFIADIDGSSILRIYQNQYLVCSINVAGMFDGTGTLGAGGTPLAAGTKQALKTYAVAGNNTTTNVLDNWNPRPHVAIVAKSLLVALVLTDEVKVGGSNYSGSVSQYTGSPNMVVSGDASGLGFFMDGFNLRSTSPLVAGVTYSVIVTETNADAVVTTKATTFSIVTPA